MTNTENQPNVTETIDAYFAFLNEVDAGLRNQLAERAWAPDARYVDPHHDGRGRETLSALVEGVHASRPGYRFERTSDIDVHTGGARYAWAFVAPTGEAILGGEDFAMFDNEGRLELVAGFHGELPSL